MKFRNILFPVDFSAESRRIAPAVEAWRTCLEAKLSVFYSVEAADSWRERLEKMAAECFPGGPVEIALGEGNPAAEICVYAERHGVDLIAMAAHGHGLVRATLGSVTARVLHECKCPVLTFGPDARVSTEMPRRILYGIDPFEDSNSLAPAGRLAAEFGAELRLVYAIPDFVGTPEEQYDRKRLSKITEERLLKRVAELQRDAGTAAPVEMAGGEVENVITEAARRHAADLVVLGHGHVHGILGSLRSHTGPVVRHSPCPVLVI